VVDDVRAERQEAAPPPSQVVYLGVQRDGSHTAAGRFGGYHGGLEALTSRLEIINGLFQSELLRDPHTEVVIAGDFNRHNPLWGGSHISSTSKQEESAPIIDFMAELSLQSLLLVGVLTFESDTGRTSTIDLVLATPGLTSDLAKCSIWGHEYGSDHRAIHTSFWIDTEAQENRERLLLKNASWDKIREAVERQGGRVPHG
jgi:hypothetical protein